MENFDGEGNYRLGYKTRTDEYTSMIKERVYLFTYRIHL